MLADEMQMAVTNIVDILNASNVLPALSRYRSAAVNERAAAARELATAGNHIISRMDVISRPERLVARAMHIESLGTADYWERLLGSEIDDRSRQTEIVRLGSRLMFATSQLPSLVNLFLNLNGKSSAVPHHLRLFRPGAVPDEESRHALGALLAVDASNAGEREPPPPANSLVAGESMIRVRLEDAGERATDPDRIARTIDGIDMVYTACASLARKPAIDLRLEQIGKREAHERFLEFVGQSEGVSAMQAVLESIPEAMADIDPEQEDIDLEAVIHSLPVFKDLKLLGRTGSLSEHEIRDIDEAMYQGALLILESGVILEKVEVAKLALDQAIPPVLSRRAVADEGAATTRTAAASAQRTITRQNVGSAINGAVVFADRGESQQQGQRDEAVDELLRAIGDGGR